MPVAHTEPGRYATTASCPKTPEPHLNPSHADLATSPEPYAKTRPCNDWISRPHSATAQKNTGTVEPRAAAGRHDYLYHNRFPPAKRIIPEPTHLNHDSNNPTTTTGNIALKYWADFRRDRCWDLLSGGSTVSFRAGVGCDNADLRTLSGVSGVCTPHRTPYPHRSAWDSRWGITPQTYQFRSGVSLSARGYRLGYLLPRS